MSYFARGVMGRFRSALACGAVLGVGAATATSQDVPVVRPVDQVLPSAAFERGEAGRVVAVDGDRIAIGSPRSERVFVYELEDGDFVEVGAVHRSDQDGYTSFGNSVALHDDLLIVGAYQWNGGGTVSIFRETPRGWVLERELRTPKGGSGTEFGRSVVTDGRTIAVGATGATGCYAYYGHVFLYRQDEEGEWRLRGQLYENGSDTRKRDEFGGSISLSGSLLAVGARSDTTDGGATGRVYLYRSIGGDWQSEGILHCPPYCSGFGQTVCASGDRVAVVATRHPTDTTYLFERNGMDWELRYEVPSNLVKNHFHPMALDGDTWVVGRCLDREVDVYDLSGDQLRHDRVIEGTDRQDDDLFGASIAMDGDRIVLGAPGHDGWRTDMGGAYVSQSLGFFANGEEFRTGQRLRLDVEGGLRGETVVLCLCDSNGEGDVRVTHGRFDRDSQWNLDTSVPPGLSGLTLFLQTIGTSTRGQLEESNVIKISID